MKKSIVIMLVTLVAACLLAGVANAQTYNYNYTLVDGSMDVASVDVTRENMGGFWQYTYEVTNIIPNGELVNHGLHEFTVGLNAAARADIFDITAEAPGYPGWILFGGAVEGERVEWDFEPLYSVNSLGVPTTAKFMFKTHLNYTQISRYDIRNEDASGRIDGVSPSAVPEGISLSLILTGLLPVGGLFKLRKV